VPRMPTYLLLWSQLRRSHRNQRLRIHLKHFRSRGSLFKLPEHPGLSDDCRSVLDSTAEFQQAELSSGNICAHSFQCLLATQCNLLQIIMQQFSYLFIRGNCNRQKRLLEDQHTHFVSICPDIELWLYLRVLQQRRRGKFY
jgi:hypothetical protein